MLPLQHLLLHLRKKLPRRFELEEPLQAALQDLARQEQRPARELQADLLAAGLAQRATTNDLWHRWQSLSPRQQEVAAFTCLAYTNRQIASRLQVAPDTVKGYIKQVLVKFNLHGKQELRHLLADWDFSAWGPPAS